MKVQHCWYWSQLPDMILSKLCSPHQINNFQEVFIENYVWISCLVHMRVTCPVCQNLPNFTTLTVTGIWLHALHTQNPLVTSEYPALIKYRCQEACPPPPFFNEKMTETIVDRSANCRIRTACSQHVQRSVTVISCSSIGVLLYRERS
jgi:hypothetical protein